MKLCYFAMKRAFTFHVHFLAHPVFLISYYWFSILENTINLPTENEKCFVVGWGKLQENIGPIADTLQEVEVPIHGNCKNNEIQICGGFVDGGKDACEG